ncbi:hypothetical protein EJB05_44998, partial [Eragrostis curvula]
MGAGGWMEHGGHSAALLPSLTGKILLRDVAVAGTLLYAGPPPRVTGLLGGTGVRAGRRVGDRARVRAPRLLGARGPRRRRGVRAAHGAARPLLLLEAQPPAPPLQLRRPRPRRGLRAAGRLATLVLQLLLGWPLYLACNAAGRPYPRFASHFDPCSPIFSGRRERLQVVLSDAGVLAVALALCRLAAAHGLGAVARAYVAPPVVVNAWLVLVTYLQHTDPAVPRYAGRDWDWLRGALATVDRDYGAFLNKAFHNIADTHVVHHLFPSLPHYHAAEATAASARCSASTTGSTQRRLRGRPRSKL